MNFPITFLITVGISIATLFVGSGVIDRLSARKHWIKQIEECQTAISATDDERIHTALRRKSHHFSKAVTRDKCVPTSPLATFNMALGFIGILLLAVIQFPPLHLPGWVDLLALLGAFASALLFLKGITTYLNGLIEQDVYEELGYPENFQRLPNTPLRNQLQVRRIASAAFTDAQKQRVRDLNAALTPSADENETHPA